MSENINVEFNIDELKIIQESLLKYRTETAKKSLDLISDPEKLINSSKYIMKISNLEEKIKKLINKN